MGKGFKGFKWKGYKHRQHHHYGYGHSNTYYMPPPMVGVPPPMYGAQTTTYTQQAYAPPPVTYSQTTMVQPVGMYPHQAPYGAPPPPYY